ncbi:transporter [Achlya hypogyna]|uniref:Transporter n=1 Tax=Achlya hypogyna TaxID=1202772 RepID=A0A1V9Z8D7_ACHHY|nr:transporter [Achlya hypogyna]
MGDTVDLGDDHGGSPDKPHAAAVDEPRLETNSSAVSIGDAIHMVGFGRFQKTLLIVSGLMFMADAVEVMLLSFLQVLVRSEWNLSYAQEAGITAAVFAGELPGALFWGFFGDKYGRRMGFLWSALCIAIFGVLSAFATNVYYLMVCRALVGFGVAGSLVPFDLMAEFLPDKERGRVLMYFQLFWTVGIAFVAILAWVVIEPLGWRWLTGLCATPLVGVLASFHWMPESPKWLCDQNRFDEALAVLATTAAINGTELDSALKLRQMESTKYNKHRGASELCGPLLRRASTMLFSIWFGFGFGYYGIILLFPRLFAKADDEQFNYPSIFLAAVAEVAGVFFTIAIVDRWGRRLTQIVLYGVSALAVLLSAFDLALPLLTLFAMVGRAAIMGASSTTWLATPEAFPTHVRTTGHGIASAMARVGGFVTPFVADAHGLTVRTICGIYAAAIALTTLAAYGLPPDPDDPDRCEHREDLVELEGLTTEESSETASVSSTE